MCRISYYGLQSLLVQGFSLFDVFQIFISTWAIPLCIFRFYIDDGHVWWTGRSRFTILIAECQCDIKGILAVAYSSTQSWTDYEVGNLEAGLWSSRYFLTEFQLWCPLFRNDFPQFLLLRSYGRAPEFSFEENAAPVPALLRSALDAESLDICGALSFRRGHFHIILSRKFIVTKLLAKRRRNTEILKYHPKR